MIIIITRVFTTVSISTISLVTIASNSISANLIRVVGIMCTSAAVNVSVIAISDNI